MLNLSEKWSKHLYSYGQKFKIYHYIAMLHILEISTPTLGSTIDMYLKVYY